MADAVRQYDGGRIPYTLLADIAGGDVVVQGEVVAVAETAGLSGDLCFLATEGVFKVAKAVTSGTAFTAGAIAYWDDSADVATTTSGGNKQMGYAVTAAADAATTVVVMLGR